MADTPLVVDCKGKPVGVGSLVRVLEISKSLAKDLPADELTRLEAMVGRVFPVTEIDKWGGAWVEREFPAGAEDIFSHSLSLSAHEMELVSKPVKAGT